MRSKITTKEAVVRLMAQNIGEWHCSYELMQKHVCGTFTGIQADRRAYDVIEDGGYFDSPNFRYFVEHRGPRQMGNPTKYAQFRVSKREQRQVLGLRDFTHYVEQS